MRLWPLLHNQIILSIYKKLLFSVCSSGGRIVKCQQLMNPLLRNKLKGIRTHSCFTSAENSDWLVKWVLHKCNIPGSLVGLFNLGFDELLATESEAEGGSK